MVGKRRARQLRCHAGCILPFPPTRALFRLSCRLHCHAQDMTGCAAMPCDSRQASRQPHPPRPDGPSSPDEVMLRITPSGLSGPHPSALRGLPLVSLCPRAVTALGFGFLSAFTPATGRPRFAQTPRSRAHFPSPPGRRRRPLRGDCFAPAAYRTFSFLSLRPVPADLALLRLPRPGVIAAVTVTRLPLRSGRVTSSRCFF